MSCIFVLPGEPVFRLMMESAQFRILKLAIWLDRIPKACKARLNNLSSDRVAALNRRVAGYSTCALLPAYCTPKAKLNDAKHQLHRLIVCANRGKANGDL
jgi:hypothetical protein